MNLKKLTAILMAACLSRVVLAKNKVPKMTVLHAEARIFLFENFLSHEECDHLMSLAKPRMERSGVMEDHSTIINDYRTSSGTFLERGEDPVIADIEQRIARWTLLPVGNGEALQVLRYAPGQQYKEHWDTFKDEEDIQNGGDRYATVLMYLSDVEEGGETAFPKISAPGGDNGPEFSECARRYLAAKPKKGNAVLFHSIKPNGDYEPRSLHTACPVIKGVKWSAPKWIHVGHFALGKERPQYVPLHPQSTGGPEGCVDRDKLCSDWAAAGECVKNAEFMVGSRAEPGACLKSCERCDLVAGKNNFRRSNMM